MTATQLLARRALTAEHRTDPGTGVEHVVVSAGRGSRHVDVDVSMSRNGKTTAVEVNGQRLHLARVCGDATRELVAQAEPLPLLWGRAWAADDAEAMERAGIAMAAALRQIIDAHARPTQERQP